MRPQDNLFLQIDAMDNSKSYVPRTLENAKELVGAERLPSKISGVLLHSGSYQDRRRIDFYINHDQVHSHKFY